MVMVGATAVFEMQPAKTTQCQWVSMVNFRFRSVRHPEAALQPAVAELAVLRCGQRPLLVEATHLDELAGG